MKRQVHGFPALERPPWPRVSWHGKSECDLDESDSDAHPLTDPLNRLATSTRDRVGYVTQTKYPDGNTVNDAYQTSFHALTTLTARWKYRQMQPTPHRLPPTQA